MLSNASRRAVVIGALVLTAAFLYAPNAQAQATGATDVDITMQGVVILHYFSNLDLTFQTSDLQSFLGFGGSSKDEGTKAANGLSPDVALAATSPTGDPASATLTLTNAWAVRSIAASGSSVTVAITLTDALLVHAVIPTANIDLSTPLVSEDGVTYAASRAFAAPGLVNPEFGNVRLTLDMTDAKVTGDYLNGAYQLTVTIL